MSYDYDLFISYAHIDDVSPFGEERGWISLLHERLSGHIAMLFVALFSTLMPIVHLRSARINETAQASGGFFFIWTLWALGGIGIFGILLAIRGLMNLRQNRRRGSEDR